MNLRYQRAGTVKDPTRYPRFEFLPVGGLIAAQSLLSLFSPYQSLPSPCAPIGDYGNYSGRAERR